MLSLFNKAQGNFDLYTLFDDFLYMSAAAISNATDFVHYEEREAEYMRRVSKYTKEESQLFTKLFTELVLALEREPHDYLGRLFMDLNLGNKWKGQFFTPYYMSVLMAKMIFPSTKEELLQEIEEKGGYLTLNEPTVGGGAMVIATYEAFLSLDVNPQKYLKVISQDIDKRAVLMTFIQTSLLGLDNTVILGDTLRNEVIEVWRTPGRFLQIIARFMELNEVEKEQITPEMLDKVEEIEYILGDDGRYALPL